MSWCCWNAGWAEKEDEPVPLAPVGLSSHGPEVKVSGRNISGTGSVLGDSPVLQDKGYFEAKVLSPGSFAIGVAIKDSPLDGVLSPDKAANAWTITHNQSGVGPVAAGDVLGCAIDQADYPVQVYFYKGSTLVHQVSGIRGEVLPVFSVADGAELEANFGHSEYAFMPNGFQGLIRVVSML